MAAEGSKILNFAEVVLSRPRMYTIGGTFRETIAFLEGYHSGMARCDPYAPPVLEWASFQEWLSRRFDVAEAQVFEYLSNSDRDDDGFRALKTLLSEFSDGSR